MVKKTKKHSKLLRILAFMSCLILLFGVIITPSLAATASPDGDELYSVGFGDCWLELSYGSHIVRISLNEMFENYVNNSTGFNGSEFVYNVYSGAESFDIYFNFSISRPFANRPTMFIPRLRVLSNSNYFDYDDLTITFTMSDFTLLLTSDEQRYIPDPLIYTTNTDFYADYSLKFVGGTYETVTEETDTGALQFTPQNRTVSRSFNLPYNQYFSTDLLSEAVFDWLPVLPSQPEGDGMIYVEEFSISGIYDTTYESSIAFALPIRTVDRLEVGSIRFDLYSGSFFWRQVSDHWRFFYERIEVLPTPLTAFFDGFSGIYNIDIAGVKLGTIMLIPLAVIVVLAVMRKFAGG